MSYIGLCVPVGRLFADDMFDLARIAEVYGSGELRLTVEQNVIIPNIAAENMATLLTEPLLAKFTPNPTPLQRALVSCTGAQFCNFALIETKNKAVDLIRQLDAELNIPRGVRIHWTGCPNSCGQPQVADIGLMGTKARKDGKTVEGVDLYMGGKVGKDAHLGSCVQKGIPCEDLKSVLTSILIEQFGATPKLFKKFYNFDNKFFNPFQSLSFSQFFTYKFTACFVCLFVLSCLQSCQGGVLSHC